MRKPARPLQHLRPTSSSPEPPAKKAGPAEVEVEATGCVKLKEEVTEVNDNGPVEMKPEPPKEETPSEWTPELKVPTDVTNPGESRLCLVSLS